jgi:hypothetical protein
MGVEDKKEDGDKFPEINCSMVENAPDLVLQTRNGQLRIKGNAYLRRENVSFLVEIKFQNVKIFKKKNF